MGQRLLDSLPTVISFEIISDGNFFLPHRWLKESTDMDPYYTMTMKILLCSFRSVDDMTFRPSHIYKKPPSTWCLSMLNLSVRFFQNTVEGLGSSQMIFAEAWGQISSIHEKGCHGGIYLWFQLWEAETKEF